MLAFALLWQKVMVRFDVNNSWKMSLTFVTHELRDTQCAASLRERAAIGVPLADSFVWWRCVASLSSSTRRKAAAEFLPEATP